MQNLDHAPSQSEKHRNAITTFFTKKKRMPSFRELADLLGFASPHAAQRIVKKWIEGGFLAKDDTGRMIPGGSWELPIPSGATIPLLGTIQAGFPTGAEEASDTITLDDWILGGKKNCFMLRVSGESMIEAGIHQGDTVIIERGKAPKNGDIVVAEVDHSWTLKYYQNTKGRVTLFPANKQFSPIVATEELRIAGVVNTVIRKYA